MTSNCFRVAGQCRPRRWLRRRRSLLLEETESSPQPKWNKASQGPLSPAQSEQHKVPTPQGLSPPEGRDPEGSVPCVVLTGLGRGVPDLPCSIWVGESFPFPLKASCGGDAATAEAGIGRQPESNSKSWSIIAVTTSVPTPK